jgi:hypothetical protein
MLPRLLSILLVLLLSLALTAKVRSVVRASRASAPVGVPAEAPRELTLAPASGERRSRLPLQLPAEAVPGLDSLTRVSVRLRLRAEVDRHYLDSLFGETDSILRHWPTGATTRAITVAIVPGTGPGFIPAMVSEVRGALTDWNPATAGLRFLEQEDTASAALLIRWTDTLEADRAGATDVTWDKAGRIRRVTVFLALRAPATGRSFLPEARRAIVLHELGHALGLPHSSNQGDVMYPVATATALSQRDRFSLRLLYELPTGWIGAASRSDRP